MEPWQVKDTPEGREKLLALVAEYEAAGQRRELGLTLTRLARLAKQIGVGDDQNGFVMSATYGQRAVEVLRQTDDRKALAAALRVAAVPFITGTQPTTLLLEALDISRSIGDLEGEGWAIYTLANSFRGQGHGFTLQDAQSRFEQCGCKSGVGLCLQSLSLATDKGRWDLLHRAADLFEADGEFKLAARALHMACSIDFEDKPPEDHEASLLHALELCRKYDSPRDEAFSFRLLRNTFLSVDPAKAAQYAAQEDELDVPAYGSREGRLRYELEGQREMLEFAERGEKKAIKAEIKRLEAELAQ
ncbi:MAG: hypothetical protein ACAH95_10820 [Fimbriimonas sp.]